MKRIITLHHWKNGFGYTHSEIFDNIDVDEAYTAKDYCDDFNEDTSSLLVYGCDAVCVELMNEDFDIMSEHWIYKDDTMTESEIRDFLRADGWNDDGIEAIVDSLKDDCIITDMTKDWLADISADYKDR